MIRKGPNFQFRFSYWLHFFAAHRMHHDQKFAHYIFSDARYTAFPEIIEFYTGIDRRRSDAVLHLTEELKRMNSSFLERTGIPEAFNPYQHALWNPNETSVKEMQRLVADCVAESALPAKVKDSLADKSYDRSKPYYQELSQFIKDASLAQMVSAMKGSARALRNSDYVSPEAKTKLLEEVMVCWIRICQVAALLSPVIAQQGSAIFEGLGFYLGRTFDSIDSAEERWKRIMTIIVDNIARIYQEDLFSKKIGPLFSNYINTHKGTLGEILVLLVMAQQRPPGWEKEIESFVVRTSKNSFYLNRIFMTLLHEYKASFATEKTKQQLRRLAAMSIAKHDTGSKHPNLKLVEKAAKMVVDKQVSEEGAGKMAAPV